MQPRSSRARLMPDKHAKVTCSGGERWTHCPRSVALEAGYPDKGSDAAREGIEAHELAEKKLKAFQKTGKRVQFKHSDATMQEHTDAYRDYVIELFREREAEGAHPELEVEVWLDLGNWVPEGFGTSDSLIPSTKNLDVIDFKYGQNTRVDAKGNTQMRLYALGALDKYWGLYEFDTVTTHIFQPRMNNYSTETITVQELREWGEWVKPLAQMAYNGEGPTKAGSWCQFCKAKNDCKTRAETMFGVLKETEEWPLMTPEEMAKYLPDLDDAIKWAKDMQEAATQALLEGKKIPGFKLIEGRSTRKIKDPEKLGETLEEQGYGSQNIWKPREIQTIGNLEKLVGKKKLAADYKDFFFKPPGKPALAPESNPKPEWKPRNPDEMFSQEENK